MFRADDDDTVVDDPYWTQPSTPSSSYDWDDSLLHLAVYLQYSYALPTPCTLKS